MTFEQLISAPQHLLLKCISGSRAQQLHSATSDTDIKGIFVLPQRELYGFSEVPQLSNETNDEVYFEIGRFMSLLVKNNPNILELLGTPQESILFLHPLMSLIRPEDFLSKLCKDTFAGYAATQVKKAKGLNKKIHRPIDGEKKTVVDFCFVVDGKGSVSLSEWLNQRGYQQEHCGLTNLPHFKDVYLLYYHETLRGIISGENANDVQLSSVPKDVAPLAVMNFNKDGYSVYCREYYEYWEWVEKRNENRYQHTLAHGKNYDAKNMMHTFRLLSMAEEIATEHKVIVARNDRDFLLRIRSGEFEYEDLLKMVEEKMEEINELYLHADLPDAPDESNAEAILVQIREKFYYDQQA